MKINPTIGGSLISGAASLFGGLFGSSSSDKAAKAQLQAVRETNSLNKELAYQQNEWNLQQWNRQNAYNDPSAQMSRFRAAGINPYFALGNITSGNAEGTLSSADLANQQPVTSPLQGQSGQIFGNALSQAAQFGTTAFYDNQIKAEQAKNLQLKNAFDAQSLVERVNSLRYDNRAKMMANEVYNGSMQSLMNITKNQERESYARVAQANLQTVGSEYDNASKAFTNKFILPAQRDIAQLTLNKMVSEIAYQQAQENWTKKQTALAAKYAAAAMLSANASWLSSKAAWNTSLSNASSVANQNWYRTQQNSRESTRFGIESKYLERSIKLGLDQLQSQFNFQNQRENMWLHSGRFNKFMWSSGELLNHMSPLKFFAH